LNLPNTLDPADRLLDNGLQIEIGPQGIPRIAQENLASADLHLEHQGITKQQGRDFGRQQLVVEQLPGLGRRLKNRPLHDLADQADGVFNGQLVDQQHHVVEPAVPGVDSVQLEPPETALVIILAQNDLGLLGGDAIAPHHLLDPFLHAGQNTDLEHMGDRPEKVLAGQAVVDDVVLLQPLEQGVLVIPDIPFFPVLKTRQNGRRVMNGPDQADFGNVELFRCFEENLPGNAIVLQFPRQLFGDFLSSAVGPSGYGDDRHGRMYPCSWLFGNVVRREAMFAKRRLVRAFRHRRGGTPSGGRHTAWTDEKTCSPVPQPARMKDNDGRWR
jgi:hypothetical protein